MMFPAYKIDVERKNRSKQKRKKERKFAYHYNNCFNCVANNELIDLDAQSCEGYIINSIHSTIHMQMVKSKTTHVPKHNKMYVLQLSVGIQCSHRDRKINDNDDDDDDR